MPLPSSSTLHFEKTNRETIRLEHDLIVLPNQQERLRGRTALVPSLDLCHYRFRALYDWIEFQVCFAKRTQVQHVQNLLLSHHHRKCWIQPVDLGDGNTFTSCSIKVQEPKNLTSVVLMHRALVEAFEEAARSRVTAIEISVDVYPRVPDQDARTRLLGAMQRTIWTSRDIWSEEDARPRSSFGIGDGKTYKLAPPPAQRATNASSDNGDGFHHAGEILSRHRGPAIDGTMYLGARDGSVMTRLMDKIVDRQQLDGTKDVLSEPERRVRVEVTLREDAITDLGISDVPSLVDFVPSALQKRFFRFMMPTFMIHATPSRAVDVTNNVLERRRAEIYLKSGVVGVIAMDRARDHRQRFLRKRVRADLRKAGHKVRRSERSGVAGTFASYEALNRRVATAFNELASRERTAWRRMESKELDTDQEGRSGIVSI